MVMGELLPLMSPSLQVGVSGAEGSGVEGTALLHQGSINTVLSVPRLGSTLDLNAPPYKYDWASPWSCNKDPRTSAAT